MNPKNSKKSPIHENAGANITCDFGDGDISRYRSFLSISNTCDTYTHTCIASSIIGRLFLLRNKQMKQQNRERLGTMELINDHESDLSKEQEKARLLMERYWHWPMYIWQQMLQLMLYDWCSTPSDITSLFDLLQDHIDDKHSPRPTNARTTTSQQQSQTPMTSIVPVRPMPALQQVNNSLRHWWQAQSPSGQCPHYNMSTTVSHTDDKHSPRPANARTTTSQQQSQTLMTSTVPVRPMPAPQQVNNSLRHWWQAQSPSGQCPHYNMSTTVSDTDDKHSPRPTMPTLQQVNNSLTHWWQAQSPSDQCPHYNKSTTVSHTDDKHSPRPANARTTTCQQQSQTLMTSTVPVRPMPALQQVNNSLRHWWQAQSPSGQCPHYNKSTTVSDTDDKHSPHPTNACTTTSQQQSQTLMTSTVPVRPMPALKQVNNSLRHWWQAQSPSDQCPHYNMSTTVSDTDDKHSPCPTNARTTTSQQQSQTLMTSTVPVRPMPALQQVNHSLRHWRQAQSLSDQCPHYNKSTTVSDTDDKHSPRPTNARTTTSQQQSQTLMTSTVPIRQCPDYNKSTTVSDTDDKHSPHPTNARTTTCQQSQTLMTSTVPVRPMPALHHVNKSHTLMTSTVPVRPMPALQQVNISLRHWWQAQSPSG